MTRLSLQRSAALPRAPFTTAQATALGLSDRDLRNLLSARAIRRVLTGVYARCDLPDTVELRVAALALVTNPFTVVCDHTAAWVWGIDVYSYAELEILPPLETWSIRGNARVRRKGCAGGNRDLAPRDIVMVDGVRVTSPLRTALDLACRLGRREALAALDAFMRAHSLTRDELLRELTRFFRRRGVVQARELVSVADPRAESQGESWTRMEMVDHGLPVPDLQVWVHVDGVPTYRLDLAYPKHRVCVEYDGLEFHTGAAATNRDRQRRQWLRAHGWVVIVVDKHMFTPEAVDTWVQEVREALASRTGAAVR